MDISTFVDPNKLLKIITYIGTNIVYVIPNIDIGINGFLFDTEGEKIVTLESDITDYCVENGSPAQDNIALRPVTYKLRGNIAEIKNTPKEILKAYPELEERLKDVADFKPSLNQAAQDYITGKLSTITKPIKTSSLYEQIKKINVVNITKQKATFFYLQILRDNRILSTIQTPWRVYTNMAIQSIIATEPIESKEITEFDITFKQINYTSTLESSLVGSGRMGPMSLANPIDNGMTSGALA